MNQLPPSFTRPIPSLSDVSLHSVAANVLASASSSSILLATGDIPTVTTEGVLHVPAKLDPRQSKTQAFAHRLLNILREINISSWLSPSITPEAIRVHRVSGSYTNAVFFVSCPSIPKTRTLLLRIYGASSGNLISRPRELHILHILSSQYHIGPKVYGTFDNGRVEEYFESSALTASDLRDPEISRWIGARMAELHCVDIETIEGNKDGEGKGWDIAARKSIRSWLGPAQDVLDLPNVPESFRTEMDLNRFKEEWAAYLRKVSARDDPSGASRRVFSHNDAQNGNLLRLTSPKEGTPEHRQIIVVDFEYASPNPASYDIANHFHEWTADYGSSEPHLLDARKYPSFEERRNFYIAYLEHSICKSDVPLDTQIMQFDEQVRLWSPASHAVWAMWALVQAREDMENGVTEPEFDHLGYASCRMAGFRRELQSLL
jgi:choline kinase